MIYGREYRIQTIHSLWQYYALNYYFSILKFLDALLKTSIGDFLAALTDPDLNVRRVALVAFNSAAHNKPSLIRDLLRKYLHYYFDNICLSVLLWKMPILL